MEQRQLRQFYRTPPMPCPYLPGRLERKLFTILSGPDATVMHDSLSLAGFRRSHGIAYRPKCDRCAACIAVRVPVAQFRPNRTHRRIIRSNAAATAARRPARATLEQYQLFRRYQVARHADGGMADMGYDEYRAMVEETQVRTYLIEFRDPGGVLIAVSLNDRLNDGLSLVYSFFAPELARRSLGTYDILWHIRAAQEEGLSYVYLGYWIAESRKMRYKARFQPIEGYGPEGWQPLAPAAA
ncbi:MAG: arginyltransferase [Alphaproteobacteria bacterium]|nr:arginyltransferase [Alphaproteobacteria bacterium]